MKERPYNAYMWFYNKTPQLSTAFTLALSIGDPNVWFLVKNIGFSNEDGYHTIEGFFEGISDHFKTGFEHLTQFYKRKN
jgi:hypothetical protein